MATSPEDIAAAAAAAAAAVLRAEEPTTRDDGGVNSERDPSNFAKFDDIFASKLMDLASGGVDRSRTVAENVQKAAAAVGTIYTGLLGLAFSVSDRPLNLNTVPPAIFLGLAMALPIAYLAYIKSKVADDKWGPKTIRAPRRWDQVKYFLNQTNSLILERGAWLRAGVVALLVGVVLIPLAFITTEGDLNRPGKVADSTL